MNAAEIKQVEACIKNIAREDARLNKREREGLLRILFNRHELGDLADTERMLLNRICGKLGV